MRDHTYSCTSTQFLFSVAFHDRESSSIHQTPFYYREGYKMCLAVYANGTGEGAGTHVSLSLFLLKGNYDDQLKWPMIFCESAHTRERICIRSSPLDTRRLKFFVCSKDNHQATNGHKILDRYDNLTTKAPRLIDDCLTLIVECYDICSFMVCIT